MAPEACVDWSRTTTTTTIKQENLGYACNLYGQWAISLELNILAKVISEWPHISLTTSECRFHSEVKLNLCPASGGRVLKTVRSD